MILTIALLLMCAAGIGIVYWLYRMIQSQMYVELLVNDTRSYVQRLSVLVASVRHDLSLDREGMDERFTEVNEQLALHDAKMDYQHATYAAQVQKLMVGEGKNTRRRVAEVKTRLTDDEKDDQKAKAKVRRKNKPVASK